MNEKHQQMGQVSSFEWNACWPSAPSRFKPASLRLALFPIPVNQQSLFCKSHSLLCVSIGVFLLKPVSTRLSFKRLLMLQPWGKIKCINNTIKSLLENSHWVMSTRKSALCWLIRKLCAPVADYSTDCDYSSRLGLPALGRNRSRSSENSSSEEGQNRWQSWCNPAASQKREWKPNKATDRMSLKWLSI